MGNDVKTCYECGRSQNLDKFPLDKTKKDGHRNCCSKCYSEYHKRSRAKKGRFLAQPQLDQFHENIDKVTDEYADSPSGERRAIAIRYRTIERRLKDKAFQKWLDEGDLIAQLYNVREGVDAVGDLSHLDLEGMRKLYASKCGLDRDREEVNRLRHVVKALTNLEKLNVTTLDPWQFLLAVCEEVDAMHVIRVEAMRRASFACALPRPEGERTLGRPVHPVGKID